MTDVAAWLRGLGLDRYQEAFRDNDIGADVLPRLTADDLKDIGVASVGDRRRLLDAIAGLRGAAPSVAPAAEPPPADAGTGHGAEGHGAERRQLTVLFCDLAGSTALSARLDPEDLREVLAAYHRAVAEVVERHGGYVAKLLGDGVLAYFGWPEAHEDDPERAVRAGLAACAAVAEQGTTTEPLAARVGIATGPVVVGEVLGKGEARERGVVGETPNLAARLQATADPGAVVADAATRRLTGTLFAWADLGGREVKGLPGPVRAWHALGGSDVESRFEALRTAGTHLPLIGRGEQLELLVRCWHRARGGEGQVALVRGEAGIGKSRLAAALREALRGEEHEAFALFCSPQHTDSALHPVVSRLERAADLVPSDAPEERLAKLEALLAPLDPPPEDAALIAELLSVRPLGRWPALDLTPQRRRERLLAALVRRVRSLAARRPVLAAVEDAHWLDPTTREFLDLLVAEASEMALLLVVTHRPEFDAGAWLGQAHVTPVQLKRLGAAEHAALLHHVAKEKALPVEVEREILARSDGVPLFVEEVGRAVLESGLLREEAERWVLDFPLPALSVPPSLQASLVARLDRLSPAREVAQVGASIGREFSHSLIAAVSGFAEAPLRAALDSLIRADLMRRRGVPPEATYIFRHALIRDAAYGTLLRERRRELHARIVAAIEKVHPDLLTTHPEQVARHCAEAGDAGRSADMWEQAGQNALAQFAQAEAASCFREALRQLRRTPETAARSRHELRILLPLASALFAWFGDGRDELQKARDIAREVGDFGTYLEAIYGMSSGFHRAGRLKEAIALGDEALAIAAHSADPFQRAMASRIIGWPLVQAGRLQDGVRHLEDARTALGALRSQGSSTGGFMTDPLSTTSAVLAQAVWAQGQPERAWRLVGEAASQTASLGGTNTCGFVWSSTAVVHLLCRQPSGAAAQIEALFRLADERGADYWRGNAEWMLGAALVLSGRTDEGIQRLHDGSRRKMASGNLQWDAWIRLFLAQAHLAKGQEFECEQAFSEAHRIVEANEHRFIEAELYRLMGLAALNRRNQGSAEEHYWRSITVARSQSARSWELRATCDLARLHRDHRRLAEARGLLAPVYAAFTEGYAFPDLVEARALLEELGAAPVNGAGRRQEEVRRPQDPEL